MLLFCIFQGKVLLQANCEEGIGSHPLVHLLLRLRDQEGDQEMHSPEGGGGQAGQGLEDNPLRDEFANELDLF